MKCALLVNRSTITYMPSFPSLNLDSLSIKFIDICSHFHFKIASGSSNPPRFRWCTYWKLKHVLTFEAISLFKPSHQITRFISSYILLTSGLLVNFEWWLSLGISFLFMLISGAHNRPFFHNNPQWSISKPIKLSDTTLMTKSSIILTNWIYTLWL